eukprot:scaffold95244_cov26-Tisochrysis_lutea.AAC.5
MAKQAVASSSGTTEGSLSMVKQATASMPCSVSVASDQTSPKSTGIKGDRSIRGCQIEWSSADLATSA